MPPSTPSNEVEHNSSPFTKLNLLWLVLTLIVFLALVKLGFWQNARALEKELRLIQIEKLSAQKPISLHQVLSLSKNSTSFKNINDVPVLIEGDFNENQVFLLDNQVNKGRLGYRVYQIATTHEHSVLVSLGWVPGSINRQEIPKIAALNGTYEFKGKVRLIELGIVLQQQVFNDVTWPLRVQQIELDKFSAITHQKLLPFVIYLDTNGVLGFEKNWQPIVMPPEKHRAYAFQWFSLALAWLVLMLWAKFGVKNNNDKKQRKAS